MAKVKIPYLIERRYGGQRRFYWSPRAALRKAGWRLERLADDRGAAVARAMALNAELEAWRKGDAAPAAARPAELVQLGTIAYLIRLYRASRFYKSLAPRTRRGYEQNLTIIERWAGDKPVAAIGAKRVEALYSALAKRTPAKAKAVVTMLGILLQHGVREEMTQANPARQMGLKGAAPSGRIWPRRAVADFVAAADRLGHHSVGTAVLIDEWLGQREGDILALRRDAWRGGRITLVQRKTGSRVSIPLSQPAAARLHAELARQKVAGVTLLICEATGRPWDEHRFRHVFAEIRAALAETTPHYTLDDGSRVETAGLLFMHLRHTAATRLAEAGCTTLQIAGITGHSPKTVEQILTRYLVRTSELADAAVAKRLATEQATNGKS